MFPKNLNLKDILYILLPSKKNIPTEYKSHYNSAYDLWLKVWDKELKELDGIDHLYSDDFTRHDFWGGIFHKNKAITVNCFSIIDFSLKSAKNDSWFAPWPKETLESLNRECKTGVLPAWLTVAPDYRQSRNSSKLNFGLIQSELNIRKSYELNADICFGTARIERGVNKVCHLLGADSKGTIPYRKGAVELFTFPYEKIGEKYKDYSYAHNYLWKRRIDPLNLISTKTQKGNYHENISSLRKRNA